MAWIHSRARFYLLALGLGGVLTTGCANSANVSSELPLSRVVVYRNGVGYFERTGEVEAEQVRFKMRGRMVGDFLATLAIVQQGGSAVRSASFPLEIEVPEEEQHYVDHHLYSMLKPIQPAPPTPGSKTAKELKDVVLHLDGKRHNLAVGYVAETPVWRPSYRVVMQEDGSADLQAWGIVQNLSGEDWDQIKLVLVAGAPLAFQSTLGDPVIPQRPIVTDEGEVMSVIPGGITSLNSVDQESAPEPAEATEDRADGYGYEYSEIGDAFGPGGRGLAGIGEGGGGRPAPAPQAERTGASHSGPAAKRAQARPVTREEKQRIAIEEAQAAGLSAPRNVSALAAVAVDTGSTRYEIPNSVSIPNESATMVLLASQRVKGEAMFLFSPEGGVPDSMAHPFRVARFTNETKGLLERGPIAVFQKGAFLGQGMLEPLPTKASATVPFALERSLVVSSERKQDRRNARLYKIENGQIMIERDVVYETTYTVKNGGADPAKLLVKHNKISSSAKLNDPPAGTEDEAQHALVPVSVAGYKTAKVTTEERIPVQEWVSWTSDLAREALEAFLKAPTVEAERVERLRNAWNLRGKLKELEDEERKLSSERDMLERFAREDRLKLKSLEKNPLADDLRRTLTARLTENTKRMDQIEKRLVEVSLGLEEQRIRFEDLLRGLKIIVSQPTQK